MANAPILSGPKPTPAELNALAQVFLDTQAKVDAYTGSPPGQTDPDLARIVQLALDLGSDAANIATSALDLQVNAGPDPVAVINNATGALQAAIKTRDEITQTLGWIQDIVTFAADIAAGNVNGVVTSGSALYAKLTAKA